MGRYLFLVAAVPSGPPAEVRGRLMRELRAAGLRVINVRVGSSHLEIDARSDDSETDAARLRDAFGGDVEVVDLDGEEAVADPFHRFAFLFNSERFWEAHEVLERVWRIDRNELIQGLIVLAAAFAKLQEGSEVGFHRLARRSMELLWSEQRIGCVDLGDVKSRIADAIKSRRPFKIECKN